MIMLTLKQCKDNAYAISVIMSSNISVKQATRSINNICDLNANDSDIVKLVKLRAEYFNIDMIFSVYE